MQRFFLGGRLQGKLMLFSIFFGQRQIELVVIQLGMSGEEYD